MTCKSQRFIWGKGEVWDVLFKQSPVWLGLKQATKTSTDFQNYIAGTLGNKYIGKMIIKYNSLQKWHLVSYPTTAN